MDNNNIKENIEHANSLYSQAKYNEAIQIYQELLKVTDESEKYHNRLIYNMNHQVFCIVHISDIFQIRQ